MNKSEVIKKLMEVTSFSEEKCRMINDIIEDYFIIGKNNKEKIINDLVSKLNMTMNEAEEIYNKFMNVMTSSIKDKIKHPFGK